MASFKTAIISYLLYFWIFTILFKLRVSGVHVESGLLQKSLGEFIYRVIGQDFSESNCVGVITEEDSTILDYVPKYIYRYHFQIGGVNSSIPDIEETDSVDYGTLNSVTLRFETFILESINAGCPLYVMQVSKPKAVIYCFARTSRRAKFRMSRYYIFLPVIKHDQIIPVDESIFLMKEMSFLPDLVIIRIKENESEVKLNELSFKGSEYFSSKVANITSDVLSRNTLCYDGVPKDEPTNKYHNDAEAQFFLEIRTHKFVGVNRAENIFLDAWIRIGDNCSGRFLYSGEIFPDKIRDVEGRQLIVVAWTYPPFIIVDFKPKPPIYDGIEFRITKEFLKYINATYRVTIDPEHYWGETFDNGTGNGATGFVYTEKADMGLSAYYSWPQGYRHVDFASTHMRSSVTLVAAKPKLKPGWLVPILPFDGAIWGAVGGSLLGCICTLYGLQKFVDKVLGQPEDRVNPYSKLDYTALRSYAMLLNQGPVFAWDSSVPRHVPARHFVGWFQFMGEVISDTYNAGLASVLSSARYEKPIEMMHDLAERNIPWAANHISWIWSIQEDEQPDMVTITKNFKLLTMEEMIEAGRKDGEMAFVLERIQGGHFTTERHINEDTLKHRRVMKDTLYWSHLYFLLRKGSPYMKHLNILIRRVREAGLPYYWEADVIRGYMSDSLQLRIKTSPIMHDEDGPNKLSLDQLQGAFFLLVLGHSVALCAFLTEHCAVMFHSKPRNKRKK